MAARSVATLLKRSVSAATSTQTTRCMSSSSTPKRKVAVLGAAGGIGQPLGLLMKLNPLVTDLSLYDIAGTPGVAADISHVDTGARVSSLSCLLAPGFSFSLSDSFFEPDLWHLVEIGNIFRICGKANAFHHWC